MWSMKIGQTNRFECDCLHNHHHRHHHHIPIPFLPSSSLCYMQLLSLNHLPKNRIIALAIQNESEMSTMSVTASVSFLLPNNSMYSNQSLIVSMSFDVYNSGIKYLKEFLPSFSLFLFTSSIIRINISLSGHAAKWNQWATTMKMVTSLEMKWKRKRNTQKMYGKNSIRTSLCCDNKRRK